MIILFLHSLDFFRLTSLTVPEFRQGMFRTVTGRASFLFRLTLRSLAREAFLLFEVRNITIGDIEIVLTFEDCPRCIAQILYCSVMYRLARLSCPAQTEFARIGPGACTDVDPSTPTPHCAPASTTPATPHCILQLAVCISPRRLART
jgi:hypothetical protein